MFIIIVVLVSAEEVIAIVMMTVIHVKNTTKNWTKERINSKESDEISRKVAGKKSTKMKMSENNAKLRIGKRMW